jgi:N-acetylglucosamine kinase-like BadF-type ATPase
MAALEVGNVHDLAVKANSDPVPEFARLFPAVVAAEESRDAVAIEVLERAGVELAVTAEIVIGRLFLDSEHVSVAMHGGVFAASVLAKEAFRAELNRLCPGAICVEAEVDPALGALEIARREFGVWHKS